jgi:hypothetical protein
MLTLLQAQALHAKPHSYFEQFELTASIKISFDLIELKSDAQLSQEQLHMIEALQTKIKQAQEAVILTMFGITDAETTEDKVPYDNNIVPFKPR